MFHFSGVYWYLLLIEKETAPASLGLEPDPEKTKDVPVKEAGGSGLEGTKEKDMSVASILSQLQGDMLKGGDKASEEKVFIAEGIRPVSSKLVKKIQGWRFIELDELLQSQQKEETLLRQDGVVLFQTVDRARRTRSKISELSEWMEAFAVFVAVISQKSPEVVPSMMSYMIQIKEAQSTWGGGNWLLYDREFRERAEAKKLRTWDCRDSNLWSKYFSGMPTKWTKGDQSVQIGGGEGSGIATRKTATIPSLFPDKRQNGPCYPFNNKGACDRPPPCPFPHVCRNCGDNHPARVCPLPQRKAPRLDGF